MTKIFILLYLTLIFSRRNDSVILILCKNDDINGISETIQNFEKNFNSKFNYPYVFLNDMDWNPNFINKIKSLTTSEVSFGKVPTEDWQRPNTINMEKAQAYWKILADEKVPYADKESYHNMCRFFSRKFYEHPLVKKFKYYWRIEPDVKFRCPIDFDPFEVMDQNGYKYSFTITMMEFMRTIPTLYDKTKEFKKLFPHLIPKNIRNLRFMFNPGDIYNGCHFWSNFEIASFEFFRSEPYLEYVKFLEKSGGFYYERWGDAPVHSLAVAMFLDISEIHFFKEIGYTHPPFTHCPASGNCDCKIEENFDNMPQSCLPRYLSDVEELGKRVKPIPEINSMNNLAEFTESSNMSKESNGSNKDGIENKNDEIKHLKPLGNSSVIEDQYEDNLEPANYPKSYTNGI